MCSRLIWAHGPYSYFGTDLQEPKNGRNVVVVFKEDMRQALKDHLEHRDNFEEAKILVKASRTIRQVILTLRPLHSLFILIQNTERTQ